MTKISCLTIAVALAAATVATFMTATSADAGCTRVYTTSGWVTRCK